MSYAENTTVAVSKSRVEIEVLLEKHGAHNRATVSQDGKAMVIFTLKNRKVQFTINLPSRTEKRFTHSLRHSWQTNTAEKAAELYEAACRQRWRALLLALKAKFISLEEGLESFDEIFLAYCLLDSGETVYERMTRAGPDGAPPMLPPPGPAALPPRGGT